MKTAFSSKEPKRFFYHDYKTFPCGSFKNDLMPKSDDQNADYINFEKEFIDTLNNHTPMKTKLFRGNQIPHVNKVLQRAFMKRLQLKNVANKTRKAVDFLIIKNNIILMVKINKNAKENIFIN